MINPRLVNNKINLGATAPKSQKPDTSRSLDNKINIWVRINGQWVRNK